MFKLKNRQLKQTDCEGYEEPYLRPTQTTPDSDSDTAQVVKAAPTKSGERMGGREEGSEWVSEWVGE